MSKKVTKSEIKGFPPQVQDKVFALMKRYRTRNVSFEMENPFWQLYLDEGVDYTFFYNDEERTIQMQAQHSLHAGGSRTGHRVGERMALPQGTWVVSFKLFLGKPFISVHHVGLEALSDGT